jgi:ubiquinone/menaquinone biosynthesis C-methylase UbiE
MPIETTTYYSHGGERGRLDQGAGQLELARTQEIIQRHLPPSPSVVYDIGGGPGRYAYWLAELGYAVHLIDASPLHIEQARAAAGRSSQHLVSMAVGDARQLAAASASADAVLMLGPLYHLTHREDRIAALREAGRVLRPGGVVLAAAISRFASTLDGLRKHFMDDPQFVQIAEQDLADGQHRNPTSLPQYFSTAYFHHPDELAQEIGLAGSLEPMATLAVEGPPWLMGNLQEHLDDPARRRRLLHFLRRIEAEPSLLGASAHLIAVARRKAS